MAGIDLKKFKAIEYKKRQKCAVCDEDLEIPLLSFPKLPLTEIYINFRPKEKLGFVDQNFHLCRYCGHGMLSNIIDPAIVYAKSNYSFRTSTSKTAASANDLFLKYIKDIIKGRVFDTIVEIGCSDLYLLKDLSPFAKKLVGIDPILKGREKELAKGKIRVYGDFFENINLDEEIEKGETLFISSHTLEHMHEPKIIMRKLMDIGNDNTLFVFQFPGLETLVSDGRFDQIFHQHLQYFSTQSFKYLVSSVGGEVFNHKVNYFHWGSLMVAFRKAKKKSVNKQKEPQISQKTIINKYADFRDRMSSLNEYIKSIESEGIVGYPAALMLPVLGYHLGSDFSGFECIIDDDKKKDGMFYINLPVKIRVTKSIKHFSQVNLFMTALNSTRVLLPRLGQMRPKRIIFPLPII